MSSLALRQAQGERRSTHAHSERIEGWVCRASTCSGRGTRRTRHPELVEGWDRRARSPIYMV